MHQKTYEKILFSFLFFLFLSLFFQKILAQSQILDDTTKQVYGTNTTFTFREIDILDDTKKKYKLDTTLNNFHHFTSIQKSWYQYQDLGAWGTSVRPLYFQTPHQIGARLGIDSYYLYLPTAENIDYFDTKSPFIRLNYVQGTTGDQSVNFIYARNVNKRLSFTLNYKRTNANKAYGADNTRDVLADQTTLNLNVQYESKNKKYRLLFHYAHLNQIVNEQGGIIKNGALPDSGRFAYREIASKLGATAQSWQTHNNFRIYQQYKIGEGLVGFATTDINRQRDAYLDIFGRDSLSILARVNYYPNIGTITTPIGQVPLYNFSNTSTSESTIYWQFDNKIGWKGRWKKFNYQVYYKNRIYDFYLIDRKLKFAYSYDNAGNITGSRNISPNLGEGVQNFVGGKLFLQLKDSTRLTLEAEHLLGRDYQLKGTFESKWFVAKGKSVLYSPSLLEQRYVSNHFIWDNSFGNVFVNEVEAEAFWSNKFLSVKPFFNYQVVGNFIYFDEKALPKQTNDILQMTRIGVFADVKFGKFRLAQQGIFFQNIGSNIFRAPPISYTGRIFCEDCLYKKRVQSQIGIEANYKSDYFGNAFLPVVKQFHLQNVRSIQGFWYLEAFMNVKIGNFRIFGKLMNILNFRRADYRSYETTPDYPALPFTFTFGIDWMFFN
ncbi:MAG: hypothetical protein EAZ85_05190 [Bacteroidetes bacterium]|nr:MAG: hypothetical protein EAZ85_05190 [Bacteroidota bacterium]TAG85278.1 MAG: hypothetical protein EAZ20_15675 [Bacteroidota bacterium]